MNLENKTKTQLISELKKLKQENELLKESRNVSEKIIKERKENEKRFKALYENIPLAYHSLDVDGKLIEVNKAWCKSLGYKKDEIIGKNFSDFLTDDSKIEFKKGFEIFKKKGYMQDVEYKMMNKDGEVLIMSCNGRLGYNEDGTFKQTHTTLNNITDRKNMEEELRSLSFRQNAILDSVPDIIMEVDNNKIYTWSNNAGQEFFGNDVIGKEASYYFEGEQNTYITVEPIFKGDDNIVYLESWQRRKDGEKRLLAWWCRVLKDKNDNVIGALSTARDITEQKQVEEALRESEEKYRILIDSLQEGIWVIDKDNLTTFVNIPMADMLGYKAKEMLGRHLFSFMDERGLNIAKKLLKRRLQGVKEQHEFEFLRKDGDRIYVIIETTSLTDDDGNYVGAVAGVVNITERKRAEEALQQNEEKLRNIIEHSTNLFYSHTHEHVLTYLSPQCKDILGYEPDEAMVKWTDLITDNVINEKGFAYTQKAIDTGIRQPTYELELLHKDGQNVWAEVREAPLVKDGKTIAIVGSLTNITERRKIQEERDKILIALRDNEERLSLALEGTGLGTWDHNYTTGEIFRNELWAEMLGYKLKELKPNLKFWESLIHPDDIDNVRELSRLCETGKTDDFRAEYRMKAKNGEWKWILDWGKIVERDKNGKPLRAAGTHLDITERKSTEKTLEESETKFRLLTETIKDVFWMSTCGVGEMIYISPRYEILWERSRESLYKSPRSFLEAIHPGDLEIYLGVIDKYHKKGKSYECEYRIIRRDGEVRWIQERGYLVPHSPGQAQLMTGVCTDITIRKKAEEENTLLAQTLISAKDCISITDLKNNLIFVNHAFLSTFGYTDDEILGKNISIVRSPHETIDLNKVIVPETLEGGWHGELNNRRKDGSEFPIELWTSLVKDATGKPIALVGISRDITERKRVEQAMRTSEERLSLALESAELGLWDQNMITGEVLRNERWAEMLGYTLSEIEPNLKSWKDLVHPDDLKIVNLAIENHESRKTKSYKVEHRMRAKNGEWKWILDWGRIVEHDNNDKPLRALGTHLDITEMKKVEDELRKYSENQAILVREINHRVRNNLSAIIGMLYTEESLARAKGAEECLPILQNLVTRIKGLATAHSMLSEVEWQPLRLTQLCENVINATIKSQYSSKTVNLLIAPSEIYVDSNQAHNLSLVINELVTNSMKYAVQEQVKLSLNAEKDGENIKLQIHDDGPGYPIEMVKGDLSKVGTGFELINGIVKKSLFGEVEISNDNGALTKIIFKNFEEQNKSES